MQLPTNEWLTFREMHCNQIRNRKYVANYFIPIYLFILFVNAVCVWFTSIVHNSGRNLNLKRKISYLNTNKTWMPETTNICTANSPSSVFLSVFFLCFFHLTGCYLCSESRMQSHPYIFKFYKLAPRENILIS